MNLMKLLLGITIPIVLILLYIGTELQITDFQAPWWLVYLILIITVILQIVITDHFLRHQLTHYINTRLKTFEEKLEHHTQECPVRKEQLLNSCIQNIELGDKHDSFRRSYIARNPSFILSLRKQAPTITPTEELLCMYVDMGLNNKEIAEQMSISQGSLHTFRYRVKRKLPLSEGEQMDDWIRKLNTEKG